MNNALRAPPWANLWRHLVTTMLFYFLIGLPVAIVTDLDTSNMWSGGLLAVGVVAYVLAAIVVWSDVPWPGDPE